MSYVLFIVVLSIQLFFTISEELSLNNSNCSLTFDVQTISQSNKIQTEFPIKLIANYNLTCNITNLTAYYKITPLEILVIGRYRNMDENIKSMIELNSTKFHFKIHQSSTIRLCILSADDDDDEDDNDNDHRICQQIHIGINKLYDFWSLPLKIVYIFMICSLSAYYIFFYARGKWRKGGKKHKSKASSRKLSAIVETNHDTFENEKVNDDESSGEEHEEQSS